MTLRGPAPPTAEEHHDKTRSPSLTHTNTHGHQHNTTRLPLLNQTSWNGDFPNFIQCTFWLSIRMKRSLKSSCKTTSLSAAPPRPQEAPPAANGPPARFFRTSCLRPAHKNSWMSVASEERDKPSTQTLSSCFKMCHREDPH